MELITATEFKAKCLELMDRVNRTGERIQITKRGKVVAELCPVRNVAAERRNGYGCLKGIMSIVGDIEGDSSREDWTGDEHNLIPRQESNMNSA
jgi:prevent-host-death family protein